MEYLKIGLSTLLTIAMIFFVWTGKINGGEFAGFATTLTVWVLGSRKIETLTKTNKELNDKITVLSGKQHRVITESEIPKASNGE